MHIRFCRVASLPSLPSFVTNTYLTTALYILNVSSDLGCFIQEHTSVHTRTHTEHTQEHTQTSLNTMNTHRTHTGPHRTHKVPHRTSRHTQDTHRTHTEHTQNTHNHLCTVIVDHPGMTYEHTLPGQCVSGHSR